ncbi:MAG: hypothetical protein FD167_47 [bacterium]|nr:MAG: hypothetical protein FD167_47 [bacterium]
MKAVAWTLLVLVCLFGCFVYNLFAQDFNFQASRPIVAPFNAGLVAGSPSTGLLNNNLKVLRSLQPNGFSTMNTIDVGIGDINGDGLGDIVSAQANPNPNNSLEKNCILIFLGTGDGSFLLPRVINTFGKPVAIELNDVDDDRLTDIVIAENGFVELITGLFLMKGIIGFDRFGDPNSPNGALLAKPGNQVFGIATGFLDKDNILDIAVAEQGVNTGEVEIFFTDIEGRFSAAGVADVNIFTQGSIVGQTITAKVIALDFSTAVAPPDPAPDGDIDIFIATSLGVEIFENVLPDFLLATTLTGVGNVTSLSTVDINLDGAVDVIAINQTNSLVTIFRGNFTGGYSSPPFGFLITNAIDVVVLNFNNDDLLDLAILQGATQSSTGAITILQGSTNGLFRGARVILNNINGAPIVNPVAFTAGQTMMLGEEISLDDLIVAESTVPNVSPGGVLFLSSRLNYTPLFLQVLSTISRGGDFDGTGGTNDLALVEQNLGIIYLLYNVSTKGADRVVPLVVTDLFTDRVLRPTSLTTFRGTNGLNNIAISVLANSPTDTTLGQIIVFLNDGTGSFGDNQGQFRQFVATSGPTNLLSADFNNDQLDDLVYIDYVSSLVVTAMNDGSDFFLDLRFRETGGFIPVSAALGDINDDDIPDLMVVNQGNLAQGNQSLVSVLLGKMDGSLVPTGRFLPIPNIATSIVGGMADFLGDGRPQIVDFNQDGFADFAVVSTRTSTISNQTIASVTLLLNQPSIPGNFIIQPPIPLFDDTPNGLSGLIIEDSLGGPGVVVGRGGQTRSGLAVGGANFLMAVGDFNADAFPDLVVTGTRLNQGNFRSAIYLVGNGSAGTMRVARPQRSSEYGGNSFFLNGADTFIGCIAGRFAEDDFFNGATDVLHISLSGSVWIDANDTAILNHAPRVTISRTDLNAKFGQGKKLFLTAGEKASIPLTGEDIERDPLTFRLVPTPNGQQPPSFITIDTLEGLSILNIDTSLFAQTGPSNAVFRVAVEVTDMANSGTGGRLPLFSRDYFTLIIKPNTSPIIQAIPEQTVAVDTIVTVPVLVSDRENNDITLDVVCDKNQFVLVDGTNLTISPTVDDIGLNVCAVTATDAFGLASQIGLTITVVPAPKQNPMIDPIEDQMIAPNDVVEIPVTAIDPEGDENLQLNLVAAPDFVTLVDNGDGTGALTLMPNLFSPAFSTVTIQVATSDNRFATVSFNIIIQGVFIVDATFDKQFLLIQGRDYGLTGVKVIINDLDISQQIISQSNFSITLKGTKRKLNLKVGDNQIQVMVGDVTIKLRATPVS